MVTVVFPSDKVTQSIPETKKSTLWKTALVVVTIGFTISSLVSSFYGPNAGFICFGIYTTISIIYLFATNHTKNSEAIQYTSPEYYIEPIPERVSQVKEAEKNLEGKRSERKRKSRRSSYSERKLHPPSRGGEKFYAETTDGMIEYRHQKHHNPTALLLRQELQSVLSIGIETETATVILNHFDSKVLTTDNPQDIIEKIENILDDKFPDIGYFAELKAFIISFINGKFLAEIFRKRNLSPEEIELRVSVARKDSFETPIIIESIIDTCNQGLDILDNSTSIRSGDARQGKKIWNIYELFITYLKFDGGTNCYPSHPLNPSMQHLCDETLDYGLKFLGISKEQWLTIVSNNNGQKRKEWFFQFIGPKHIYKINVNDELPSFKNNEEDR